eukprot:CAMPEP_0181365916 /NCGR_PEP_ID=MMETSP1106-20121128/10372_1 /TAXON_ID=81844 /ORGANISM="Mantoniella antarctica, Strain SL-175" /LENGTH=124 /DNA_ID=CAMNT_0023481123 /DNA_START=1038 /DNA_END=1409 /DNA_ORIENTATION=+
MSSTVYRLDARGIPVKRPVLPPQRAGGMMDVPQQRGSHHGMCAGREEGEAGGDKEGWEGHSGGQPGRTVGGGERAPSLQQLQQGGRGDASEAMTSGDRGGAGGGEPFVDMPPNARDSEVGTVPP